MENFTTVILKGNFHWQHTLLETEVTCRHVHYSYVYSGYTVENVMLLPSCKEGNSYSLPAASNPDESLV